MAKSKTSAKRGAAGRAGKKSKSPEELRPDDAVASVQASMEAALAAQQEANEAVADAVSEAQKRIDEALAEADNAMREALGSIEPKGE